MSAYAKKAKPKIAKKSMKWKKAATPVRKSAAKSGRTPSRIPKSPGNSRTPRRKLKEEFVQKVTQGFIPQEPQQEERKITYPVVEWAGGERVRMLIPVCRDLARKGAISDWRVNVLHERSANVYLGGKLDIEDQLDALREDIHVTVYVRFPDKTIGEATVPIITDDPAQAREQLLQAAAVCAHARKPSYPLPSPQEVEFPQGHDPRMLLAFTEGNGMRVPLAIAEQMRSTLAPMKGIRVCSAEALTSAAALRVVTSTGIDVSFHKTRVYMEVTLAVSDGKDEREFHWYTIVVSPEQLDVRAALEQQASIARDAVRAQPNPGFSGDVLLAGQSLLDFFVPGDQANPLLLHASARIACMGLSQLKLGAPIGQFIGEPFTISSNPRLPLGLLTAPLDEEGVPLRPVEIIRTGVFASHIARPRYAAQLGVPVTGEMSNVHIADGATREEHLRGQNYVEIVAFSWFNPDPFSGDFSAEVRLAYHWVHGRKTPLRGGTFTGNVFKGLLNARFSREAMQSGRYYGPRALLFKGATITPQP
jgi:PmbA protein